MGSLEHPRLGKGPPAEGPWEGARTVRAAAAAVGPGAVRVPRGGMSMGRGGYLMSSKISYQHRKEKLKLEKTHNVKVLLLIYNVFEMFFHSPQALKLLEKDCSKLSLNREASSSLTIHN